MAHKDTIVPFQATADDFSKESEQFHFFGEEGFDSVKIDSKLYRFAGRDNDIEIFEMKNSSLRRINFKSDLAPQIYRFIHQITDSTNVNDRQRRKIEPITISTECNKSCSYPKIAKENGTSILVPMGLRKSNLHDFLTLFSNFVELSILRQEEVKFWEHENTGESEEITISKLIFNYEVQRAFGETQQLLTFEKHPQNPILQAYSDASDSYDHSDESFFSDDFLGHAIESDRRPPLSKKEEIKRSKFNRTIYHKSQLVTSENFLPTENLNTQIKLYRKSQKNKRRHSMTTRSQTRYSPWV
ncbi:unnamed protein product [Cuscuta europaea]|uniref:Uncharacterized protein n=1 Tax=Cuscuta europaea TaxID=41803 RepID=A0A9P1EMC5_CUSEU|nr:unnamed protein product [Cuscuta europaea]